MPYTIDDLLNLNPHEVVDLLNKYQAALIWCGAASDLQPGGKAHKGWRKVCEPLINRR